MDSDNALRAMYSANLERYRARMPKPPTRPLRWSMLELENSEPLHEPLHMALIKSVLPVQLSWWRRILARVHLSISNGQSKKLDKKAKRHDRTAKT